MRDIKFLSYLSWFAFLYPFMFETPALSAAFEQLCECLCLKAPSACPAEAAPSCLFLRKAEKSFFHLDLPEVGSACCECVSAPFPVLLPVWDFGEEAAEMAGEAG